MIDVQDSKVGADLIFDKSKWKLVRFDEVAFQRKGIVDRNDTTIIKYIKGEHMGSEDLHVREWGELTDEYLGPAFIRKFEKGDVLYGSRRTYLRKVAVADFDGITSNTTFVINAKPGVLNPDLLPFIMLSEGFAQNSIKNSKGSVNPYINWKDIGEYEFILPPIEQQAELAELLWSGDEMIEKINILKSKLYKFRETFFLRKIEGAKGEYVQLKNILKARKDKSQIPHLRAKYVGLENISSGQFECDDHQNSEQILASCNVFNTGDLCYNKLRPYLDKAFVASFDGISTTELLIYKSSKINMKYILNHFHSKPFLDYVSGKVFGTKMPRVSDQIIGNYSIKKLGANDEDNLLKGIDLIFENIKLITERYNLAKQLQKSLINQIF